MGDVKLLNPLSTKAIRANTQFKVAQAGFLSAPAQLQLKSNFKTQAEALAWAQQNPGAEMMVEKESTRGQVSFDVYQLNTSRTLNKLEDVKQLKLVDAIQTIENNTGTETNRAHVIAANGEMGDTIYKSQFERPLYDTLREKYGLDGNRAWQWLVDTVMGSDLEADKYEPLNDAEIADLRAHLKPGDLILNGSDGSFIHGMLFVGKDKDLQTQLERKWLLPPGALDKEAIILHSLLIDSDVETEFNGKKQRLAAAGTGVVIDTLERYQKRHPRDQTVAITVKDATEADRQAVIANAKRFVGRPYDHGFNTYDDSRMYCTEFVTKSWMAASNPPEIYTQRNPLVSYPAFIVNKLPESLQAKLNDGGFLHQEMFMTDGLASSPSMELVWANRNIDKSEFFKKHQRWAAAVNGTGAVSEGYQQRIRTDQPGISQASQGLLNRVQQAANQTRAVGRY